MDPEPEVEVEEPVLHVRQRPDYTLRRPIDDEEAREVWRGYAGCS